MDSLYSALKNHANVKDEKQFNPINPISELLFQKQKKKEHYTHKFTPCF